jgi:hypothetical protein
VEVQRLVNAAGIITLGNQVIQVGSPLAGQRARIRLSGAALRGAVDPLPGPPGAPRIGPPLRVGQPGEVLAGEEAASHPPITAARSWRKLRCT